MSPRVARADFKRGINYGDVPEVSSAHCPKCDETHVTLVYFALLAL